MGITHRVSCPHTHQRNGSAERKHRHIVEVGLSLLAHASVPLKYWDEAFLTAVFIINRLSSRVINNDTTFYRLHKVQPDYSFLRTFGSACCPNLRPYNSRKLEFRSKRCVFLGYSNLHKGFKCLDPTEGRVYLSGDVIFDENVFPFASLHPNVGARLRSELSLLPDVLLNLTSSFGDVILHDRTDDFSMPTNSYSSSSPSHGVAGSDDTSSNEENAADQRHSMCRARGQHCCRGRSSYHWRQRISVGIASESPSSYRSHA